jgi:hypothetical protein
MNTSQKIFSKNVWCYHRNLCDSSLSVTQRSTESAQRTQRINISFLQLTGEPYLKNLWYIPMLYIDTIQNPERWKDPNDQSQEENLLINP